MAVLHHRIAIETTGLGLYDVTAPIGSWLAGQTVRQGLLNVFIQHTSASLVIQENADPDVLRDLEAFFRRVVPEDARLYRHDAEGPDDMPAHIRSALTQSQLGIPVIDGRLALGTWQAIYLFEHRRAPHHRTLLLTLLGA
jgi:secondary thiamine-phosphate synthase enzyme